MQIPVYNKDGEKIKEIEVSDLLFDVPFNKSLVHQVMVAQLANERHGTSDTKTRSEVSGSSRKLYREKGTGNARAGSSRSPTRRHGGVAFGPHPRDYRQATPKKMRQLALKCILSSKMRDGEIKVLENLHFDEPKTKEMNRILNVLGIDSKALIVDNSPEMNMIKSANNLSGIKTLPANLLNTVDLLSYKILIITEEGVRKAEELWAKQTSEEVKHASV